MMHPYAKFLVDFDRRHPDFSHCNSSANRKAAIVIESRPLYFLPMVLKNVMFFLGREWNLYVVCGELSEKYIDDIVKQWDVHVIKLDGATRGLSPAERSTVMKSTEFWKAFSEEKLLLFDSNSVMCGSQIHKFLDYDFIGAPIGGPDNFTLHGGFSLRTRRKLMHCVVAGRDNGEPEDLFFTRVMRQTGGVTPDFASACRFAVSSTYLTLPVGVPATDECLHTVDVAEKIVGQIVYK